MNLKAMKVGENKITGASDWSSSELKEAYQLGSAAAKRQDKTYAPVQDKKLMQMLKDKGPQELGASKPLFESWSKGWHETHLKMTNNELKKKGFPEIFWKK